MCKTKLNLVSKFGDSVTFSFFKSSSILKKLFIFSLYINRNNFEGYLQSKIQLIDHLNVIFVTNNEILQIL